MQQAVIQMPEMRLVGIAARTNNAAEIEPSTAKIGTTVQHYFNNALAEKISNRTTPETSYCVYTDYESDFTGVYTYFIGEVVSHIDSIPEGFSSVVIPAQSYVKFTNGPGPMPDICIETWQSIWKMSAEDLGGERSYLADFEIYDKRATNYNNVVLDICIGIKS